MNVKEKAKELIEKYLKLDIEVGGQYDGYLTMKMHDAKQCAIIAVDEVLSLLFLSQAEINYWQKVKNKIEKL